MELSSKGYAKFKRTFVGPRLTRKQRLAIAPSMPAEKIVYKGKYLDRCNLTKVEKRKALWSAYLVERRKKRDKSMPGWADTSAIAKIYEQARIYTKQTGIKHEVDHIIPSNHPLVCGLHVETNLQILTEFENRLKSNRFIIE